MLKRKRAFDASQTSSVSIDGNSVDKRQIFGSLKRAKPLSRSAADAHDSVKSNVSSVTSTEPLYRNKQRVTILSSRGIGSRERHLMQDLLDLLPHSKKEVKLDTKDDLGVINELAELNNSNGIIFLEARKRQDLYMWLAKVNGPSVKFLVQNTHTLAELKLTGNCLKGSRPLLLFDSAFDVHDEYRVIKELFQHIFGTPKAHPRSKPFIDHVFSFFIADHRIWFRNYQIVHNSPDAAGSAASTDPLLIEIGPRFVLNPIKVFSGSFGGQILYNNPNYVSPNEIRAAIRDRKAKHYIDRVNARAATDEHRAENVLEPSEIDTVFLDDDE